MRILLIENNQRVVDYIFRGLREHDFLPQIETDGKSGLIAASAYRFDVMVISNELTGIEGIGAVRILRMAKNQTPIIMITDRSDSKFRISALDAGADDCLEKPLVCEELRARIQVLTRRGSLHTDGNLLEASELTMNRQNREVTRSGTKLNLMPTEYQILEYFMLNPNRLITRTMFLENIWGLHFDPGTSVVQTHLSRLRNKVDKPFRINMINTVRGSGYMLSTSNQFG